MDEDQILEIFPHDIILPACPETPDERADDVFLNVTSFVDDELEKIYGKAPTPAEQLVQKLKTAHIKYLNIEKKYSKPIVLDTLHIFTYLKWVDVFIAYQCSFPYCCTPEHG